MDSSPPSSSSASNPQPVHMANHYSGNHKIPTINQFIESLDIGKKDRDKELESKTATANKVNAASQAPAQAPTSNQTPQADDTKLESSITTQQRSTELKALKDQKKVTDPTTSNEVVIENAQKSGVDQVRNPILVVPNANLGKGATIKTDASQSGEEYRYNQDVTAPPAPIAPGSTTDVPIRGEKTNVLFHPTPSVSYEPMFAAIEKQASILCTAVFFAVIFLGRIYGGKWLGLIAFATCLTSGIWLWMKEVVRSGREVEWQSEKVRGQMATTNLLPESVEWLNSMLEVGWGMINPEMFSAVADTLEDVMQASAPSFIENIRVAEINQGSNPLRILSLRSLPDSHVQDMKDFVHEENKRLKDPQEAAADEEGGEYYNLEAAFAYHAKPTGQRASDKARNMHMQLVFYLGVKGLFGIPLPIFVELQSLVGTVRLRLQITREPPFLKTLTFTLMGVPHVQAGCIPMFEKGVNILNLPLISNFVNYAIGAAASMYVAPKSMVLDMRSILQGDDITKDVHALGVLWIRIHRATSLSKQDRSGSKYGGSDPYITLSFSKYGKPMYCTRVITDDLNPIFEESHALLVTPELIQANENLSVDLWDSDRHSADDIVGKVELSIQKMIQHPGKMFTQLSKLSGTDAGSEMPGNLDWEVGYFGKPKFRPELRTDGKNNALSNELRDDPKFQDEQGTANTDEGAAAQYTPPDPLWPSGIVSVIVHQIVNLELENIKGTDGIRKSREFEPAKPYGESKEEQGGALPTSYCTICLNDELIYRTRAKAVSSQPIFNAGTERFIRDWRSAIITVTVRDQRNREHDPILGIAPLRLSNILDNRSQVTRWYPLDGGIGFGRIRISLLFRSVELSLPPNMLGWDVGTFEFVPKSKIYGNHYPHNAKIKMRTGGSISSITRNICEIVGDDSVWDLAKTDATVNLPVKYRYRSPIVFEFHVTGKRKANAYATYWLDQLNDNEEADIDIPIWTTQHPQRLVQNHINESNCQGEPGLEDLKEVGRLKFRGRFKAGMDQLHGRFITEGGNSRETFETWEASAAEGVRTTIVEKEVPEQVQKMHEKSLSSARAAMKQEVPESEKQRKNWITKDGTDWSGAFEVDASKFQSNQLKSNRADEQGTKHHHDGDNGLDDHSDEYDSDDSSDIVDLEIIEGGDKSGPNSPSSNRDTVLSKSSSSGTGFNQQNKRTEARKHRGRNQWRPIRNMLFAADQSKVGLQKLKKKITGGLDGRQPGVESEIGQ